MYSGYYYPTYRTAPRYYPYGPYPLPYPYLYPNVYNSGTAINAFQSQIGYQNFVNTGTATNVNQVFSPYAIY